MENHPNIDLFRTYVRRMWNVCETYVRRM